MEKEPSAIDETIGIKNNVLKTLFALNNNGYIKAFRKLTEWEWYNDANTFRVFMHLLLTANYEESKWQGITIKPGQLITGRKKLAKDLKLSERQIRTSISRLKSTSEIAIKSTNKFSIVTICKWSDYQGEKEVGRPTKRPATSPSSDHNLRSKEVKEVLTREFEKFWSLYGKKQDRKKCLLKWKTLSQADKEKIFQTLPAYIASTPDKQFRKNPLTYLNGEVWHDEETSSEPEKIDFLSYSPAGT